VEPAHPQLRCRSWRSDLCGLARLPVDEHLRRSGGTATCKTVARRDCAPHTVMRAGRPRTRHARGSIMLHFARVRMSLSPRASRLAPHPLAPHPLATAPAASTAAALLRPSTLSSHVQRATSTFNPSRLIPSPRPPLPLRAQRRCASPRCRPTFNVQRSTFNPSRLIPWPRPPLPLRAQRRCAPTSPCRPLASHLLPLSPLASCPSRLLPLAP
jgi:hypothetical protein